MDSRIHLDTLPKDVLQDTCIALLRVHARKLQYFCNTYVQYCWKGCIHGYCIHTGSIHVAPGLGPRTAHGSRLTLGRCRESCTCVVGYSAHPPRCARAHDEARYIHYADDTVYSQCHPLRKCHVKKPGQKPGQKQESARPNGVHQQADQKERSETNTSGQGPSDNAQGGAVWHTGNKLALGGRHKWLAAGSGGAV